MNKFCKALIVLFLCVLSVGLAQAGKISLKFSLGGTYLLGGDFNKIMDGWRDYEQTVLGPEETFTDNLDKLRLGFQGSVEALYELSPRLSAGIEVGFLRASVTSGFSRTWNDYRMTLTPTLSGIPILLNVHYFLPLGGPLKLQASIGGGILLAHFNYEYRYENLTLPYNGTWVPEDQVALAVKAGIGVEYALSDSFALTFDLFGRYAEISDLTGEYSGVFNGSPYSGVATAYYYDNNGLYPTVVLYSTPPTGSHVQNLRKAAFSFSGLGALFGVKITI
jgi:hypothetical protein